MAISYPHLYRPNHPLAPKSGIISTHRIVLYDAIGEGPHACHWCGKIVHWERGTKRKGDRLLVDHLDGDRVNLRLENLVPSCNRCNTRRQHPATIAADELVVAQGPFQTRAVRVRCATCGKDFLKARSMMRDGKRDFCSRACSRAAAGDAHPQRIRADEETIVVPRGDGTDKRLRALRFHCGRCGQEFVVSAHRARQRMPHYCSRACANASRGSSCSTTS